MDNILLQSESTTKESMELNACFLYFAIHASVYQQISSIEHLFERLKSIQHVTVYSKALLFFHSFAHYIEKVLCFSLVLCVFFVHILVFFLFQLLLLISFVYLKAIAACVQLYNHFNFCVQFHWKRLIKHSNESRAYIECFRYFVSELRFFFVQRITFSCFCLFVKKTEKRNDDGFIFYTQIQHMF